MVKLHPADPAHSDHLISTNGVKAQRVWYPPEPLYESTVSDLLSEWRYEVIEQCGFIDSEQDIWIMNNVHQSPRENFRMNDAQVRNTLDEIYNRRKRTVIGIFHTHPNNLPWPSPRDIVGWPNPKLGWRYFIVTKYDVLEWELVT